MSKTIEAGINKLDIGLGVFPWGTNKVYSAEKVPMGEQERCPCRKFSPGGISRSSPGGIGKSSPGGISKSSPGGISRCTRAEKVPLGEQVKVHRTGERPRYPYREREAKLPPFFFPTSAADVVESNAQSLCRFGFV